MPIGDLAREDEYGDPLIPPPVNPLTGEGMVGLSGKQAGAAFKHSLDAIAFPGRYMAGPGSAYPPGSEEAQFLEDSRERSATDWGRKMGVGVVGDPVPAGLALASGQSLRGAMGSVGAGAGQGIKAYHSSPHDFEKFDFSKIGTGEGAQVYGHGGYFAESPGISGQGGHYWKQFKDRFYEPEITAAERLQRAGFDRDKVTAELQQLLEQNQKYAKKQTPALIAEHPDIIAAYKSRGDHLQAQLDMLKSGKPVGPRTYEVNINADPERLLDWDKPLSKQPESIQRLAAEGLPRWSGNTFRGGNLAEPLGGDFYQRLALTKGKIDAPKALQDYNIPGIRYLDAGSRAAGTGTSNYVMFPGTESMIDILKKYGVAGTAPLGALAAQDQYRQ
jgi:hypothetical protein